MAYSQCLVHKEPTLFDLSGSHLFPVSHPFLSTPSLSSATLPSLPLLLLSSLQTPPPSLLPPRQSSPAADSYDLLSVCPTSDRVFMQACSVLPVDIVTVDLTNKLPFTLKYTQLTQVDNCVSYTHTEMNEGMHTFTCLSRR